MLKTIVNSELFKSGTILAFISSFLLLTGFISGFAQSRVLGIPTTNNDFTLYVERGGNFLIQSIQSLYSFPFFYHYLNINIAILIAITLLITLLIIFKYKYHKSCFNIEIPERLMNLAIPILIFVLVFYIVINLQKPFLRISSIIQPTSSFEINNIKNAIRNGITYDTSLEFYNLIIKDFYNDKFIECQNNKSPKCLFDIRNNLNSDSSKKTYISLLQIIIVLSLTLLITTYLANEKIKAYLKSCVYFYIFTQSLIIPYIHGTIGIDYIYPIVDISISNGDKEDVKLSKVIYLSNHLGKLYFLDRKKYMAIYSFETSNIKSITQLSKISLFVNCSQKEGEVVLCEESFWHF